jgi:hypothetical protein
VSNAGIISATDVAIAIADTLEHSNPPLRVPVGDPRNHAHCRRIPCPLDVPFHANWIPSPLARQHSERSTRRARPSGIGRPGVALRQVLGVVQRGLSTPSKLGEGLMEFCPQA